MGTTIKITPPGGAQDTIVAYDKCTTILSATSRAGSFSVVLPGFTSEIIDKYPVGSDVQIIQDGQLFRGWVLNPAKTLYRRLRLVSLDGPDYTAKTQKVLVTESYVSQRVDVIVQDLFATYLPWVTVTNIESCSKVISIKFSDVFFWDAMETLCKITGYEWYIDENLDGHFFQPGTRINPVVISQAAGNYRRGTANLTPDSSKLVNRLWVKGNKALSDPYTQNITVGAEPIPLFYKPRASTDGVTVTVDGVAKTLGIQNLTPAGTVDFLLNFNEKLLIPDLCTSGTGTIVYRYEYPIKILLEDPVSQAQYGVFDDVYKVDTNDHDIALELGMRYLAKYSQPVLTGSIEPFEGAYKPGELVKVEIPDLNVDEYLQVKEVTYESVPLRAKVERKLQLESPERDLPGVLKDISQRLAKLEKEVYQDDDGPVERYIAFSEAWGWSESVTETVHACPICSDSLYPADNLYPC